MFAQTEFSLFSHILLAFQLSLGMVFLLSAWSKTRSPLAFAQNVAEYKLAPAKTALGLALILIFLEAFLAIAFLTGWLVNVALPLAITMLILFFIAVGINLRRGRQINCGCFGDSLEQISLRTLARLLLLLTTTLVLLIFNGTVNTLSFTEQIILDSSTLIYLMQTIFFAAFLLLMANWFLNLPELAVIVRHGYGIQFSYGDVSAKDGKEDT